MFKLITLLTAIFSLVISATALVSVAASAKDIDENRLRIAQIEYFLTQATFRSEMTTEEKEELIEELKRKREEADDLIEEIEKEIEQEKKAMRSEPLIWGWKIPLA